MLNVQRGGGGEGTQLAHQSTRDFFKVFSPQYFTVTFGNVQQLQFLFNKNQIFSSRGLDAFTSGSIFSVLFFFSSVSILLQ